MEARIDGVPDARQYRHRRVDPVPGHDDLRAESDEKVAHEQLDRFVEHGGNFVDTADVYADGESETIIGRWLGPRTGARDRVVLATKGRFARGDGPNGVGLSRVSLTRALEASLRRLGVDTIGLYQAHAWDPLTPIEETLRFFDDAVRAGKIQYGGAGRIAHGGRGPTLVLQGDRDEVTLERRVSARLQLAGRRRVQPAGGTDNRWP